MTLTLTIENLSTLPDGGPLSISVSGRRGIDIGRDQYLDWTLPDPDRTISGKHAEIRYRDGGYWLRDVSRNGTFLNRSPQRLQEAHRLRDGDRIEIGHYVILARVAGEVPEAAAPAAAAVEPQDYWDPPGEAAPPIPSRDLRPPAALRPVRPDFIDWAVDLPGAAPAPVRQPAREAPAWDAAPRASAQEQGMDWARASPAEPPPPRPAMPSPRRPAEVAAHPPLDDASGFRPAPEAGNPWSVPEARPAPMPAPTLPPPAPPPARPAPESDAFVRRFAAGLGVAPETLSWQDQGDLAEEAGLLLRLCAENLKQLLAARAESRRTVRAANQTIIQALDNNPLKFAPTVDDALRIMLGRPSSGYLDARHALEAGFRDLKTHQVKTYAAMQSALRLLLDDLSPEGVAASDEKDRGLGGLLGSRKARLWDLYATRWDALASSHDDGMVDAFMVFFADCYDKNR